MRLSLALLAVPASLAAQSTSLSLDLGTSRMRFADSVSATAVSLSPAVSVVRPRAALHAFGTFSQLAGASSNSGSVLGSVTSRPLGPLSGELEGIAGGSGHSDGARTGQMMGTARLHVSAPARGLWLGFGTGQTWDGAWRSVLQGGAGAWLTQGLNTLSASLSPTRVADSIRYADAVLGAVHSRARWQLHASIATRLGDQLPNLPANASSWGNVGAVVWATPRVGIAASAGTYPVDFTQGFPGGRFMTLSLRLRSVTSEGEAATSTPVAAPDLRSFRASRVANGRYRLTVHAPGATSVELSGDFTQWTPVALASDRRGTWSVTLAIMDGAHEVNVRMNGGPWQVPPGLIARDDEFGGRVGLLGLPQ